MGGQQEFFTAVWSTSSFIFDLKVHLTDFKYEPERKCFPFSPQKDTSAATATLGTLYGSILQGCSNTDKAKTTLYWVEEKNILS